MTQAPARTISTQLECQECVGTGCSSAQWGLPDCREAATEIEALRRKIDEAVKALEASKAAGQSVLSALDEYNAKHGTYLVGPSFFHLGRSLAATAATLASIRGETE